jgi:hypothetical protein
MITPQTRRGLLTGSLAGAGLAAFGQPAPAFAATEGLAVLTPSGDLTGATDHAAIQAALADTTRPFLLSAGSFFIHEPIVLRSNQRLSGAGAQATKITQIGPVHGVASVSSAGDQLRDHLRRQHHRQVRPGDHTAGRRPLRHLPGPRPCRRPIEHHHRGLCGEIDPALKGQASRASPHQGHCMFG